MDRGYLSQGSQCLDKEIIQQFWISFDVAPTQQTFDTLFSSLLNTCQVQHHPFTIGKQGQLPQIKDPLKVPSFLFREYFNDVLQVVLYRLIILYFREDALEEERLLAKRYLSIVLEAIAKEETSLEKLLYFTALILNNSRSYIDDNVSAIIRGNQTMKANMGVTVVTREEVRMKPYYYMIFEALNKVHCIYNTKGFRYKLKVFLQEYQFNVSDQNLDELLKLLKESLYKIRWLDNCFFYGMAGINLQTYLSLTAVEKHFKINQRNLWLAQKTINSFIIATKLHEDAHHLIRIQQNNFLALTPRKERQWEAGYSFELRLFGAVISNYERTDGIDNLEIWEVIKGQPLLGAQDIESQKTYYDSINFYSSGICAMPQISRQR